MAKCAVAGIALFAGLLPAQRVSVDASVRPSDKQYIEAAGEATVTAKPDQAVIDVGVVTEGSIAATVAAQNAKLTDTVLAELRKIVEAGQLKTTGYSLRPNYKTAKPGTPATIDGYTGSTTVEAKLSDLTLVGKVIDAALQAGANNIQNLQFGLKNPQTQQSQALKEAAIEARANAEAIAMGLGLRIVRVLSAEQFAPGGDYSMPKRAPVAFAASAVQTQVEPGTIEISATVTLKVEVADQPAK